MWVAFSIEQAAAMKPHIVTLLTLAAGANAAALPDAAGGSDTPVQPTGYSMAVTTSNRVSPTLSNFGALGDNFTMFSPSLEFLLGSLYEHLPRAGVVGGRHAARRRLDRRDHGLS